MLGALALQVLNTAPIPANEITYCWWRLLVHFSATQTPDNHTETILIVILFDQ